MKNNNSINYPSGNGVVDGKVTERQDSKSKVVIQPIGISFPKIVTPTPFDHAELEDKEKTPCTVLPQLSAEEELAKILSAEIQAQQDAFLDNVEITREKGDKPGIFRIKNKRF